MTETDQSKDLLVRVMSRHAKLPTRATSGSVGYDLYSSETVTIEPGLRVLVGTGLAVSVGNGRYGRVASKSGLATRHSIDVGAGVIDRDYRGELKVLLINNGDKPYVVMKGKAIGQLILETCQTPNVTVVDVLDDTERGDKGFGSTDALEV